MCCCIHWPSVLSPSSGVTGAGDVIVARACNCYEANAWRCKRHRLSLLLQIALLCCCLGRSGHIIVSTGLSGWFAMLVLHHLDR